MIGFHASHELYAPSELLRFVQRAQAAGFAAAMCSDHFHPWTARGGESGFAWSWLGAALHATTLPFGVVCAPGQRYHPAIVAQASATLAEMFPGRFWLAVGSGEALNEAITGGPWPPKAVRQARLLECAEVMRRLWRGETVDHDGLVRVRAATLYTRPETPPPLLGAALSEDTAEWLGGWADGLITVGASAEGLRRVVEAFHRGGGRGKRLVLQASVAYAATEEEALAAARERWPQAVLSPEQLADIDTPAGFDAAARPADPAVLRERLHISSDVARHIGWLQEARAVGFDEIYLHYIGPDLARFLDVFGDRVLPAMKQGR